MALIYFKPVLFVFTHSFKYQNNKLDLFKKQSINTLKLNQIVHNDKT